MLVIFAVSGRLPSMPRCALSVEGTIPYAVPIPSRSTDILHLFYLNNDFIG